MLRKISQDVTVPLQFELNVLIVEDRYDPHLHNDVSTLPKHSKVALTQPRNQFRVLCSLAAISSASAVRQFAPEL